LECLLILSGFLTVLANAGEQFQWKKPTKPVSKSAQDKTVQEIKDLSSTLPSEVTNASVMAATSDTDQNVRCR
jgi:hypothetical protein